MILLGLGANLPHSITGPPRTNCGAALEKLEKLGVRIDVRSPWYESQPVPQSEQPWYVNCVVAVKTSHSPYVLMEQLLKIETELGRTRNNINGSRTLDIDILAFNDFVIQDTDNTHLRLQIPHPRMHLRSFVIMPLCDISSTWVHPVLGHSAVYLRENLPKGQKIQRIIDAGGMYGTEWREEGPKTIS